VEGAFDIPGIVLHYDDRSVTFTPVFLYGQGVTGCVEAAFHTKGSISSLGRLFMRSGTVSDWTYTPAGALSRSGQRFDESTFFGLIWRFCHSCGYCSPSEYAAREAA
jgi:hypothetical protein